MLNEQEMLENLKEDEVLAVQVDPQYQESPLYLDLSYMEDIGIFGGKYDLGNRWYNDQLPDFMNEVLTGIEGLICDTIDNPAETPEEKRYDVEYYFTPCYKRTEKFTDAEVEKIYDLCNSFDVLTGELVEAVMEIVTGRTWEFRTIRGSVQSDWTNILYDVDVWTGKSLEYFETEYSNEGNEWIIYQGDCKDVSYSTYTHGWSDKDIKEEIADSCGYDADKIKPMKIDGYVTTPKYALA